MFIFYCVQGHYDYEYDRFKINTKSVGLQLIWSRTHLIPGLQVSHFYFPWTNDPHKIKVKPPGQMVPNQFGPPGQIVPNNLVPLDKWFPNQGVNFNMTAYKESDQIDFSGLLVGGRLSTTYNFGITLNKNWQKTKTILSPYGRN